MAGSGGRAGAGRPDVTGRPALALEGVGVTYPRPAPEREHALRDLSLSVEPGEWLAVVGPAGSGKSTFLAVVAGVVAPTGGRVLLDDRDVTAEPAHRRPVNAVVQGGALFTFLPVGGNVAFGPRRKGLAPWRRRVARRALVEQALCRAGAPGVAHRRVRTLSRDEQQRVALARALVNDPGLLLLDEPFRGLDAALRRRLVADLAAWRGHTRQAVLLVTHEEDEVWALADRVAVLDEGTLTQLGTPRQVYDRPLSRVALDALGPALGLPGPALPEQQRRDLAADATAGAWVRPDRVTYSSAPDVHVEPGRREDGERAGSVRWPATVLDRRRVGHRELLELALDGLRARQWVPRPAGLAALPRRVVVTADADDVLVLPAHRIPPPVPPRTPTLELSQADAGAVRGGTFEAGADGASRPGATEILSVGPGRPD